MPLGGATMEKVEDFLRKHPTLGFATSLWAFVQPFMNTLTPILQFIALIIGLMIGAITLRLKIMEYNEKKAKQAMHNSKE
jgi:hypothetical protein